MSFRAPILAALLTASLAGVAAAQDSGNFVMRLGSDTTGVEHYSRSATRLDVDQVGRSPRVLRRHLRFDYGPTGALMHASATITPPAGGPPVQTIEATFTADSALIDVKRDTTLTRIHTAVPAGTVVIVTTCPWSMYERQTMKLAAQKGDSLRANLYYLGANTLGWVTVRRLGTDSMVVQTQGDLYHARVDRKGMIQNVVPLAGTQKFSADRLASLDLDGTVASYAAREKQAGAMGVLSPRDTVRANAGGATMWIDYGRPGKRGRTVFGGVLVPWGQVWRTGANAATQFKTDKALEIGGVAVPAGFYTIWTIPSPTGWKLVINSETGQWGTEHKAEKDLYTIDMAVAELSQSVERFTIAITPGATGGTLEFSWDTTRASVPFTVKS